MALTRREFGRLALGGLPAVAWVGGRGLDEVLAQGRPNSIFGGVPIGVITYSYRSMPDQSAEATLKYIVDSGISAIELMGDPVERFAGAPLPQPGGGRAGAPAAAGGAAPFAPMISEPCDPSEGREGGPPAAAAGRRGQADLRSAQQAQADALKQWRTSVSMDRFKAFRKMYNDAGVSIYAVKILNPTMSQAEMEYVFNVAEALGCTHTTLELPTDAAALKRIGDLALRKKIYAAYHTHLQGSMTAFDRAFALSKGNMANVDFGHYVAAGSVGGTPVQFLQKYHDRIASFHLKDRTTPEHCAFNLEWGKGDTPIAALLQTVKKNGWKTPATIELEYQIPQGSNAVTEVRKCLEFCRRALA